MPPKLLQGITMSNANEPVIIENRNGVAHVRFNRPDTLNAIDQTLAEKLSGVFQDIRSAQDIRVVVLSGVGKAFMAGGDLTAFHSDIVNAPQTAESIIRPFHQALAALADLPQPVIASLHGAVAGAGVGLALASDFAIAATGTRFTLAYAAIGTSPDGGASWLLPRVVGLRKAIELTMLSAPFDADEALRLGMINRVVDRTGLDAVVDELSERLARGPGVAYGHIRRLMRASYDRNLVDQMEAERHAFTACARTGDFAEGVDAFFSRRPPEFIGK